MESAHSANHQKLPNSAAVMCLDALTYTPDDERLIGCEQERSYKISKAESNDPTGEGGKSLENKSSPTLFCVEEPLEPLCRVSKHPSTNIEHDGDCEYGVLLHPAEWNVESSDEELDYASIPQVASSDSSPNNNVYSAVSQLKVKKFRSRITAFSDNGSQTECMPNKITELYICEESDELFGPTSTQDNFTVLPHSMGYLMRKRKRAASGIQNSNLSNGNTTLYQLGKCTEKVEISEKDSPQKQEESGKEELPDGDVFQWTDSMTLLLRKLDQLNLDIEDALSASPSLASTPATKRREGHQQPALPLKLSQEMADATIPMILETNCKQSSAYSDKSQTLWMLESETKTENARTS